MKTSLLHVPLGIWLGFLASSILFILLPEIDLAVAGMFYTPSIGFEANGAWYERLIYQSVEILTVLFTIGLILLWSYRRLTKRGALRPRGREFACLFLVLALGPGLIVNLGLKANWGRARPVDLVQFGGTQEFSPAFVLSDQGGGSFPSGHVAAAAWLFMAVLLVTGGDNRWMGLMLGYCLLVAVIRMAAGGHFASDILTASYIVVILTLMLRGFMLGNRPDEWTSNAGKEVGRQ